MRSTIFGLSALAIAAVSAPAFAQDEAAGPVTLTGSATVVSDYRFRGISQSYKRFAVQGGLTATHSSGLYVSVWGSSIDDYIAAGSDTELDLIAGYSTTVGGVTIDGGVLYYYYPNSGGANTDFFEPYLSVKGTVGPATIKVGAAYAPKQAAIGLTTSVGEGTIFEKKDNLYVYTDLSAAIPNTPLSLTAHLGHSFGPSYLTIGKEYTDWSVGAAYTWKNLTFGVSYVDTDKSAFVGPRNISKAGVVGSIGVAF